VNYSLILVFVIVTIFTVSLTETIQTSDGVLQSADRLKYNVSLGEIQSQVWILTNNEDSPIILEFFAEGPGSELLKFESSAYVEPGTSKHLEVFVEIPADHKDNIEYHPSLYALKKGVAEGGATGITINVMMRTTPFILIGENPIYTPPVVEPKKIDPEPVTPKVEVVKPIEDTMEERLEKIKALNEANKIDTPEEAELVTDDDILPEPIVIVTECGWFEIFLSWFGIGKC